MFGAGIENVLMSGQPLSYEAITVLGCLISQRKRRQRLRGLVIMAMLIAK